jgi:sugar lactone lactonase YvrE
MRTRHRGIAACLLLVTAGCGEDEDTAPAVPVTNVTSVASEGFQSPLDAVASPDGSTFYFTAYTPDAEAEAAIFAVPGDGGPVQALHSGAPLALPTGLVLSCDGELLIVADMSTRAVEEGVDSPDGGAIYAIATSGGTLAALQSDGIYAPTGLALSDDCATLYVTGTTAEGMAALFKMRIDGGSATVVHEGAPLRAPTGLYVDKNEVAWVLDHLASSGENGALFAIHPDGSVQTTVEGLALGTPGGCSLDAAGTTAIVPTRAEGEVAQLTSVELGTGNVTLFDVPDALDLAGLRVARGAPVFALVDQDGNRIFKIQ